MAQKIIEVVGTSTESFDKAAENPYCTAEINSAVYEIDWGEIAVRLNFE